MNMDILNLLSTAVRLTAPVLLITMGGLFALKCNIFNLALDGIALFGCFASIVGAHFFNSTLTGVLFGAVSGVILCLIYGVFVFQLKVDPVICAIAFISICGGLTRYLLNPLFQTSGRVIISNSLALPTIHLGFLEHIPYLGPILNDKTILVYAALLTPFLVWVLLYKTKYGLALRAAGLNSEVANSAGINLPFVRYSALALSGLFCGLAGAQLALSLNMFNIGMTDSRGFTALAVLIMTDSAPILSMLACFMFGLSDAVVLQLAGTGYNAQLLEALPYVVALVVVIVPLAIKRIGKIVNRRAAERKIITRNS